MRDPSRQGDSQRTPNCHAMNATLPAIDELVRMPSPCPAPVGNAFDGTYLWIGSTEVERVYAIDPRQGTIVEEWAAPGTPYGMTTLGDELRVTVGDEPDDDRSIARLIPGHGFKSERMPCPDATGVWLAYDGESLFLSQRFAKRILELDEAGNVRRTIPVRREVTGMTIVDGTFYLMTTESKDVDDYRVVRLDARGPAPVETELARVDFLARGLAYDGAKFWTNVRLENAILAFARPD
jgi:hypothetical protein